MDQAYGGMKTTPTYCVGETCHGFTSKDTPCKKKAQKCSYYCAIHDKKIGSIHPSRHAQTASASCDVAHGECPICYELLSSRDKPTACGHRMHKRCLTKWLKTNTTCPMCRHTLQHTITVDKPVQRDAQTEALDDIIHWVATTIRTVVQTLQQPNSSSL